MLHRVRLWARSVVMRRRLEREMQEEMAAHLTRATSRLIARGLPEQDARHAAVREFGNVAYLQEEARDARGSGWVDTLRADCQFALRHFVRQLGTTATMLAVLIGGMTISTLLFSYVHAYAFRAPPGVTLTGHLVRIRGSQDAGAGGRVFRIFADDEFLEYRRLTDHFTAVAGWSDAMVALGVGDDTRRRGLEGRVSFVTENYFSVLGVRPQLGPGLPALADDDPALAAVAVIGHVAWEQLFARSPNAIGSTVVVNGVPVTVVGVAPERFVGFPGYASFQLWMPLAAQRLVLSDASSRGFRAVGRLRAGIPTSAASAAVAAVAARTAASNKALDQVEPSADVVPLLAANSDPMFDRDIRLMSVSVGLLALLVLLITCTNVSALLTGLATARRQEIAIRLSLGAARPRLIRQLLTESALLASIAGAGALSTVWVTLRGVTMFIPGMPFEVGITWPAIAFTFGVALAVGVLFGLSPALHATRLGLAGALRDSTGTIAAARGRLQRGLVVAQVAFTQPLTVVLAAVLLFLVTQFELRRTELADRLISVSPRVSATIPGSPRAEEERRKQSRVTMNRLLERLERTPGIEDAAIDWGGARDLGTYMVHRDDRVGGVAPDALALSSSMAASKYFDVKGIRLVRGRRFATTEVNAVDSPAPESPVIVGADLARRLWGGGDPIGRRLQAATDSVGGARTLVVVGVIDDPATKTRTPGENYRVYLPPDTTRAAGAVLVRTSGLAQSVVPTIRDIMLEVAPDTPARIRTLGEIEDEHIRRFRLITTAVTAAGLIALFLSAIGLYAVVAFSVGQRTREIAVRMAVGARGSQIVGRFVRDGLRLGVIGLALGLPLSLIGLRALMELLDDEIPRVPLGPVTVVASLGVIVVAAAAAWIPARRAAAVDPAVTLRGD